MAGLTYFRTPVGNLSQFCTLEIWSRCLVAVGPLVSRHSIYLICVKPAKGMARPDFTSRGNKIRSHHRIRHVFVCHNSFDIACALLVSALQIKFSRNSHCLIGMSRLFICSTSTSVATLDDLVEKLAIRIPVSHFQ